MGKVPLSIEDLEEIVPALRDYLDVVMHRCKQNASRGGGFPSRKRELYEAVKQARSVLNDAVVSLEGVPCG